MSGVSARRARTSSLTDCRETPIASASSATVIPTSGRKSSRSMSPGWVGRRFLTLVLGRLIVAVSLSLVIVTELHIVRIAVDEAKADSPRTFSM